MNHHPCLSGRSRPVPDRRCLLLLDEMTSFTLACVLVVEIVRELARIGDLR
jgi:hypothetical protein